MIQPNGSIEISKHLIGICGPPSSHKTTTATYLRNFTTGSRDFIKEFARDWIERHKAITGPHGQLAVLMGQRDWELQALGAYRWVVSDSPQFLSWIYAGLQNFDLTDPEQRQILKLIYGESVDSLLSYSRIYLLSPRHVVQDGVRSQDDDAARLIYERIKMFLDVHIPPDGYLEVDELNHIRRVRIIIDDMLDCGIITRDEVQWDQFPKESGRS